MRTVQSAYYDTDCTTKKAISYFLQIEYRRLFLVYHSFPSEPQRDRMKLASTSRKCLAPFQMRIPQGQQRCCFSRNRVQPALKILASRQRVFSALFFSAVSFSSQSQALNLAVISGCTRTAGPPNPILGPRVETFVASKLEERGHTVQTIDPRQFPLLEKPQFCYAAKSQIPEVLKEAHTILEKADAYVCITPEYNHAPSPGLLNVLNHFGSSTFSFKPSAIVSYSAGQWGGTRAAIGLRSVLSELGCLPVSAMIHIPKAQDILDENGLVVDDEEPWRDYCDRCFAQLEWWGSAAKNQRTTVDPFASSPSFRLNPSQRNAPAKY